jgi:tRNA splicing ligase
MGKGVERMRLPIRFAIKQRGFLLDLSIPEDMAKVTSSKELSKVAKRVSKMVDDSVEKQRKVRLAEAEVKSERRTMDRIIQRLASDGSHRQVSKARSADETIP